MLSCFLPEESETLIRLNFKDGEPIEADAIDLQTLIDSCRINKIPEDSTLEAEIVVAFKKRYNRTISRTAASLIWDITYKALEDVKKKLYQPLEL